MCRPSPVPPSLRRVVKNGSKARRCTSSVMPMPSSAMLISTWPAPTACALDADRAVAAVREGVGDRVQEQVGQHLAVGARIAVHHEAFRHRRPTGRRADFFKRRPQARDDLLGRLAQVELAALGVAAVDRDLLERLDQLAGALQVGDELLGGLAAAGDELVEPRAAQRRVRMQFARERVARAARSSTPPSG